MQSIIFAGIASVAKYWASFGFVDLVLIDEAHLVSPTDTTMYQTFINGLKSINPYLKVIGFTATPWRLGQGKITEEGGLFTDVCFDITGMESFNRLIAEGYLSPLVPRATQTKMSVDGVHLRGGEYIASELQTAVDKEELTRAIVQEMCEMAYERRKWLIFAAGVQHALHVSEALKDMGIYCPAIYSGLNKHDRDRHILDYRAGRLRYLVNNNVLTTGLDVPDIDFIGVTRPTASPVLWVQMLGRGTRPVYAPGFDLRDLHQRLQAIQEGGKRDCLVGDFAGNTRRLGPINDPVIPRKKGKGNGDAPVRLCEKCGTYNHASVRKCTFCGFEFPVQTKMFIGASTEELIKGELPVVEAFKVDHISYSKYEKHDRPASMKVTYYSGIRAFSQYVCFEHQGYAARKAKLWWLERSTGTLPTNTDDAITLADQLRTPTHISVWTNRKYPEILAFCYDGTAFNKQEASDSDPGPSVEVTGKHQKVQETAGNHWDNVDDDIPF